MKLEIIIGFVILTASCKAGPGSLNSDNWLVPECGKADANAIYVDAPDTKFGVVDGNKVCVSGPEKRIHIEPSIRFLPKTSGLNQIEFECDLKKAGSILAEHPGERLYLFVKGKPFGEMRTPEVANGDWCTMSAPTEFSDALGLCESLAEGMGLDKAGCAKPCVGGETVCAVVKENS